MNTITHHLPDALLTSYAAGTLPHAFAVVVASHVSLCKDCRIALEAQQALGGVVLTESEAVAMSPGTKSALLAMLDRPAPSMPDPQRSGIYPGPVIQAMHGRAPRWKRLGMGVRQDILFADAAGTVRLLFIPPGQAVPDHGHNGLELTLVLQGSFRDETGQFGVGDVEVANEDLEHVPVANEGLPCICLAATDAGLRFRALVPRLLQPIFRI